MLTPWIFFAALLTISRASMGASVPEHMVATVKGFGPRRSATFLSCGILDTMLSGVWFWTPLVSVLSKNRDKKRRIKK